MTECRTATLVDRLRGNYKSQVNDGEDRSVYERKFGFISAIANEAADRIEYLEAQLKGHESTERTMHVACSRLVNTDIACENCINGSNCDGIKDDKCYVYISMHLETVTDF
jgi:hypothetical protein